MRDKSEWEVSEVLEDFAHVKIDHIDYFVGQEEACIAHTILLLNDELKKIVHQLESIRNELS